MSLSDLHWVSKLLSQTSQKESAERITHLTEATLKERGLFVTTAREGVPFHWQSQHYFAFSPHGLVSSWWLNYQHLCSFNTCLVSVFCSSVQFSLLPEWENGGEWKLNTRQKLVHHMSIFMGLIWRICLGEWRMNWIGWNCLVAQSGAWLTEASPIMILHLKTP